MGESRSKSIGYDLQRVSVARVEKAIEDLILIDEELERDSLLDYDDSWDTKVIKIMQAYKALAYQMGRINPS